MSHRFYQNENISLDKNFAYIHMPENIFHRSMGKVTILIIIPSFALWQVLLFITK
jgi:hypothetical protein